MKIQNEKLRMENEKIKLQNKVLELENEKNRIETSKLESASKLKDEIDKLEQERSYIEKEKLERQRLRVEKEELERQQLRAEKEELERQRLRVEREKLEQERLHVEREKLERERLRMEKERLEQQRLRMEKERLEQERLEHQRLRAEKERLEQQRLRMEKEILEQERLRIEKEKIEQERSRIQREKEYLRTEMTSISTKDIDKVDMLVSNKYNFGEIESINGSVCTNDIDNVDVMIFENVKNILNKHEQIDPILYQNMLNTLAPNFDTLSNYSSLSSSIGPSPPSRSKPKPINNSPISSTMLANLPSTPNPLPQTFPMAKLTNPTNPTNPTKPKTQIQHTIKQFNMDNLEYNFDVIAKNINEVHKLLKHVQIYITNVKDYIQKMIDSLTTVSVPIIANLIHRSERNKIQYFINELDRTVMGATYNGMRILYHPCDNNLKKIIFPIFLSNGNRISHYIQNRIGGDGINFLYILPKIDTISLGLKKYAQDLVKSNEILNEISNPLPYDNFGQRPKYYEDLDKKVKKYWDPDYHFQKFSKALEIITLEQQMVNNFFNILEIKSKLYDDIKSEMIKDANTE
jgi:myosin heavy subunit